MTEAAVVEGEDVEARLDERLGERKQPGVDRAAEPVRHHDAGSLFAGSLQVEGEAGDPATGELDAHPPHPTNAGTRTCENCRSGSSTGPSMSRAASASYDIAAVHEPLVPAFGKTAPPRWM